MTLRAGVIGSPAKHSLSPLIHNAWLKAAGIDGEYGLFDIALEDFETTVHALRAQGYSGLNVTVPFKERALALADRALPAARIAGAANVLSFQSQLVADNTDGIGVLYALPAPPVVSSLIVVLGAGGAAAGAITALLDDTGCHIAIVNRTLERAAALAERFSPPPADVVTAHGWGEIPGLLAKADLLVNATSMGLEGKNPLTIDLSPLKPTAWVMDMVYKPLETEFLKAAKSRGHLTIDGLDMLIGQARPSFETFFHQPAPAEPDVRALCLAELKRRGG